MPFTRVVRAVCSTPQPMAPSTSTPKRASPCSDADPTPSTVTSPPLIAAIASGYVADEASASTSHAGGLT